MPKIITGLALAPGLHVGRVQIIDNRQTIWETPLASNVVDTASETVRLRTAFKQLYADIMEACATAQEKKQDDYVELLVSYAAIIDDSFLITEMVEYGVEKNINAQAALYSVGSRYIKNIAKADNKYLSERVSDIQMLFSLVLAILDKRYQGFQLFDTTTHSVFVAPDMAASDIVSLAGSCALILSTQSKTSHLIIMARSYGIPVVGGIDEPEKIFHQDQVVIVDGDAGEIIIEPSVEEEKRARSLIAERKKIAHSIRPTLKNAQGRAIKLTANIAGIKDLEAVRGTNADGIGLFRTEFLFMEQHQLIGEEKQYGIYRQVLETMEGKEVVIRTLDLGGDKELKELGIPKEDNPFLGWRSIRYCLDNPIIFKTQLRALLRASVHGKLAIMIPMIISPSEMLQTRAFIEEIKQNLKNEKIPYDENISIGMMVETPAAAICIEDFIPVADFFSIGSNDLTQYMLAVDRHNERVAKLYDPYHPALLATFQHIIKNASKHGKKVSMCGELAGDPKATKLLIDMGLCNFSLSAPRIPAVYNELKNILG